ncbi:rod-capping linker protein [Pleurocapsa sp. CCALA 161]|uniref:phycobilisome linker polypeptide n=1 Tax=Pleurocapsa sp. CCALA 161 TaxID=2107688 RepID=UPI000D04A131|nr:phycobilisome linker polypeptide [Pleurocapsa sp. CCALA 161]PSB10703.1 rod-capping linker protein [Pleurocapsa sp. CCALA 161]
MSGMITTGDTNISTYGNRTISIDVTGVCRQDVMRTSNYTVKVPYSRMSQTIQSINRMGGKVAGISLGNSKIEAAPATPAEAETEHQEKPEKSSGGRKNRNRK